MDLTIFFTFSHPKFLSSGTVLVGVWEVIPSWTPPTTSGVKLRVFPPKVI